MGTVFGLDGGRADGPVTPLGTHHVLLVGELPPVGDPLLSAAFPLLLSQNPKLLYYLFGFQLLHFLVVGRVLKLDDVLLLVFEVFEDV